MSQGSRCLFCKNYTFGATCTKYPTAIPEKIFTEERDCKFYEKDEESPSK